VSEYFQAIVDRLNSIETFEQELCNNDTSAAPIFAHGGVKDTITSATGENYIAVISMMKFMNIIYESLKLIRNFP
jgi:hypothetical protein